ncbi:MAG: cytidine deaminase [Chitinophagales bacterium]|nr:cytidine deaminase [Sphingobacteriales bacterium]
MNKLEIRTELTQLSFDELNSEDKKLAQASKEALNLSHAPYSKFKVGCAISLENQIIVLGANQENASYPMCLCAEGSTLAAVATQHPNIKIDKVAIHVPLETPASPCGFCRQSFKEYETRMNKKFDYLLVGNSQVYAFHGIDTLLPLAFSSKDLID